MDAEVREYHDGYLIVGDSTNPDCAELIHDLAPHSVGAIIADPPYGNIIRKQAAWDVVRDNQNEYATSTLAWIKEYQKILEPGGAFYLWGGYGINHFRPFFEVLSRVEHETDLRIANFITWSKKRAYGIQWGYLQTREDVVYMVNGDHKKPRVFNVPHLDMVRGYAGYNAKYPAHSEYLRRTSVWTDITEILRGKQHPAEKPVRLAEIMIGSSSRPGDTIVDPFAGSGSTAIAARNLGRRWILVENEEESVGIIKKRLGPPNKGGAMS